MGKFADYANSLPRGIQTGLFKSAVIVEADAARLAPVDTGFLRNSIDKDVQKEKAIVFAGADYAAYLEFGTSTQRAQPFMRPALRNNIKKIIQIFAKEMEG
jgi:HK97 gp10 family phage protein